MSVCGVTSNERVKQEVFSMGGDLADPAEMPADPGGAIGARARPGGRVYKYKLKTL